MVESKIATVQLTQIEERVPTIDQFVPYRAIEDTLFNEVRSPTSFTTFADIIQIAPYKRIKGTSNHGQDPDGPEGVSLYEYSSGEIFHKHGEKLANAIVRGEDFEAESARYKKAAETVFALNGIDLAELASKDGYIIDNLREAIPDFDQITSPVEWLATEREQLQLTLINLTLAQKMNHFASTEMGAIDATKPAIAADEGKTLAQPGSFPITIELYDRLFTELDRKNIPPNTLKYFAFMLERYALHMPLKVTSDRMELTMEGIIHGLMEKITEGIVAGEDLRSLSKAGMEIAEKRKDLAAMARIKVASMRFGGPIRPGDIDKLQYCLPNYVLLTGIKKHLNSPEYVQGDFYSLIQEDIMPFKIPAPSTNSHY